MKTKQKIRFSKVYKNWYILFGFSVILALLILILGNLSFLEETELKLTDHRFRLSPIPERADTNIVIISIDDGSLEFFQNNGISWPWPRSFYGYAVDYFTAAGARAVLFDMQFYEQDIDREETDADETDGAFSEAISASGNVILGSQLSEDSLSAGLDLSRFNLPVKTYLSGEETFYKGIRAPIPVFLKVVKALGIINVTPDPDGVIRRVAMVHPLNELFLPQIAFSGWYHTRDSNEKILLNRGKLKVGKISIPVDRQGNYFINWYGNRAGKSPFKYYPFQAVIASASNWMYGREPQIPLGAFEDKYIIIGATAAGLLDLKTNPFTKILPGMEIWATSLSNYLNTDFVRTSPRMIDFLIILLIIFLIFYSVTHFTARKANIILLLMLIILIGGNYLFWITCRILINISLPAIAFIFSYLMIVTISYLLEGKSKREIRKIFSRYLHPDVINKLEADPDQIQLGGEEIEATVLYTDIYNFTTLSETKTPRELVEDLNTYFQKLTGIVLENGGLLDKYTGDGIMALFGAPIARADHALLACMAAYTHKVLREELARKTELTAPEKLHVKTRTGINSGTLVAGNIGSDKRMDYTAIGDTVNLAARLEGVNKIYQTNIIISETTYKLVKHKFVCRELDYLRVKGKTMPTRIYELLDYSDKPGKTAEILKYEQALESYRDGNFKQAADFFRELSDNAAKVMLDRCDYLLKNPPEKWDGILTLEVK